MEVKLLSQYHLNFLNHLLSMDVDFLVIGGQARFLHFGSPTRDLDIWAPIDGARASKLESVLKSWISDHPMHNDSIAYANGALNLKTNMQIHIPMDDVWFLGSNGEAVEIKASDGIDILTSVGLLDFGECFARALDIKAPAYLGRCLSITDLKVAQDIRGQSDKERSG